MSYRKKKESKEDAVIAVAIASFAAAIEEAVASSALPASVAVDIVV